MRRGESFTGLGKSFAGSPTQRLIVLLDRPTDPNDVAHRQHGIVRWQWFSLDRIAGHEVHWRQFAEHRAPALAQRLKLKLTEGLALLIDALLEHAEHAAGPAVVKAAARACVRRCSAYCSADLFFGRYSPSAAHFPASSSAIPPPRLACAVRAVIAITPAPSESPS